MECLRLILIEQVRQFYDKLEYNQEVFNKAYYDLEYFFFYESVPTVAIALLVNFESDVELLDITNELRIRKMNFKQRGEFLDQFDGSRAEVTHLLLFRYIVEFDFPVQKLFGPINIDHPDEPLVDPQETMNKLKTALRLFKPGYTTIRCLKEHYLINIPFMSNFR